MPTQSVAQLLGESAELRPLQERLETVDRLQRCFLTLAPEALAKASRVCAIDGTTVVICATSGAVAAALRQIAPRLLEGLLAARGDLKQNQNQELTAIRVEVQVTPKVPRRKVAARGEMPVEKLESLARQLSDSPLKDTVERIARDPQNKRTREKT